VKIILHITERKQWEKAKLNGIYHSDTLGSQGFIHCSNPQQVVKVANVLFHAREGLVLLCIETDKVRCEIRYEGITEGEKYPHIYGPLNIDAVITVLDFKPQRDGKFALPKAIFNIEDRH